MHNKASILAAHAVMERHIEALNARDEQGLAETLHFPHVRLSGTRLKTWETPDRYFADFRDRAGSRWTRSAFDDIRVLQASDTKVHLEVEVRRYDANDAIIASFRSLWVITCEGGRWAAKLRSSFAPQ